MVTPIRATIVGAGNVAWGLGAALAAAGAVKIKRVISRHRESAAALASALGHDVEASTDIALADRDADIVILAVSDSAIAPIAASAAAFDAIWVHTSGSVDSSVLASAAKRYGVIYPMQTFTRGVKVDLSASPIFIEASDDELRDLLTAIAGTVSSNVRQADSRARRQLHCAAVFACNFTNHLWHIADRVAAEAGASIADFMPLINETLRKAKEIGPRAGQTGPARRGDRAVMDAHEALLPLEYREIYHLISQSITSEYEQD